jgi:hypothetical protein
MPRFFVKLIAPRPTFAMDMDAQQRAMMAEHFTYWKSSDDAGEVIVFEPGARSQGTRKGLYGVGVIAAADEAAARPSADPVIKSDRGFACEVYPARGHARSNNKRVREASYG